LPEEAFVRVKARKTTKAANLESFSIAIDTSRMQNAHSTDKLSGEGTNIARDVFKIVAFFVWMDRVAHSYPMLLLWGCPVYPMAPYGLVSAENGLLKKLSAFQTRLIAKAGWIRFGLRVAQYYVQARPILTLLAQLAAVVTAVALLDFVTHLIAASYVIHEGSDVSFEISF
jgi:hypothetical protein